MARTAKPIPVSEEQRMELEAMVRSHKLERRYGLRAQVIVLSHDGHSLDGIIKRTGMTRPTVNKWRNRFRKLGVAGLKDAPRPGKLERSLLSRRHAWSRKRARSLRAAIPIGLRSASHQKWASVRAPFI
ncbi:MAG: helix-turn-helix domain-containing protein [Flavobacteriales bacterium]|nr:helix-turn-helix domain-containing protein [Flavobacteriales bacterium]MBL0128180.1 helix-turn-helix domain-containing protein [Flavobacteriales bacterium]